MTILNWNPGLILQEESSRRRRVHKKSRKGCRNCRLRSIKCDESKPECNKCLKFGVKCNFDPRIPDLQMALDGVQSARSTQLPTPSRSPSIGHPVISNDLSSFQSDAPSLERLRRFQGRTVLTIGTGKGSILYQKLAFELTLMSPFLMHVVQAMTSMHERYLNNPLDAKQTIEESYHISSAASLFNRRLSQPVQPSERDALWCTSAMLGVLSMASNEAATPQEAWPLSPAASTDLAWINISKNKEVVWQLTNPLRHDSLFHSQADEFRSAQQLARLPTSGNENIPFAIADLCNIDKYSTSSNNPYYTAVHSVAKLIGTEYEQSKVITYLSFLGNLKEPFKTLLVEKDPRALLMLSYWYAIGCKSVWWIEKRAITECQAICIYLDLHCWDDALIQDLLLYPKMHCGMAPDMPRDIYSALLSVESTPSTFPAGQSQV